MKKKKNEKRMKKKKKLFSDAKCCYFYAGPENLSVPMTNRHYVSDLLTDYMVFVYNLPNVYEKKTRKKLYFWRHKQWHVK